MTEPRRPPSGQHRLTVDCPRCGGGKRVGLPLTERCEVCEDTGQASLSAATKWHLEQGARE